MSNSKNLSVDALHNSIVVTDPSTGLKMSYWREGQVLVATRWIRGTPSRDETRFLVAAWKAAHWKARELGWLRPVKAAA
jgi:hypothetical protein